MPEFDERSPSVYIYIVKMLVPLIFVLALTVSCGSAPQPVDTPAPKETAQPVVVVQSPPPQTPTPAPEPAAAPQPQPPAEPVFNPASISQEKFDTTKADVQALIGDLNRIIKAKNFNSWRGFLSASFFEVISSKDFLDEKTEELYKRDQVVASNLGRDPKRVQKKILKTPKDYFDNVVVPSRQNDRVDDIEFVTENQVIAYTVDTRGNRLILYDLAMIDDKWKIVN